VFAGENYIALPHAFVFGNAYVLNRPSKPVGVRRKVPFTAELTITGQKQDVKHPCWKVLSWFNR